jgi:hypothetical protein
LVASAARTASGSSASTGGWGAAKTIRAQLNVSAASGTTPNLIVTIEDTLDGGANWNTIGSFAAKTAAGLEVINITQPFGENVRVSWAVSGTTPSFTFSVSAYSE